MQDTPGALLTSVLVADDEEFVRTGIRSMLLQNSGHWTVVRETSTVEETYGMAQEISPAVVVLDQCLPGGPLLRRGDGVWELCRKLAKLGSRVVVYANPGGTLLNRYFQRAGACATVGKNAGMAVLKDALESVARGTKFHAPPAKTEPESQLLRGLTARQAEIIRLLALGRNNPEIARECAVSVRTVESHRARIRRQIGADSLSELTRFAHDHGLIC